MPTFAPTEPADVTQLPPETPRPSQPTATAVPPTLTIAPTETVPDGPTVLPAIEYDLPPDIMEYVSFFAGGGGGPNNCTEVDDFNWRNNPLGVAYTYPEEPFQWLDDLLLLTCGWVPGERVFISLFMGDTNLESWQSHADKWGGIWVDLSAPYLIDYPPGDYQYTFHGASGEIRYPFTIQSPNPTLYRFFDQSGSDMGELLLAGFQSGETIRILLYDDWGSSSAYDDFAPNGIWQYFVGWTTVRVGSDGQLRVIVPPDTGSPGGGNLNTNFAAVGEQSGEARSVRAYTPLGLLEAIEPPYVRAESE